MTQARTTEFLFDGDDYFAAHLDNGGVRFGLKHVHCIDALAGTPLHAEILALTPDTAEEFHDRLIEVGHLTLV
nr:hypothetical protein [uncultured Roseateles sp.]